EARLLSGEYNLVKAAKIIHDMGPTYLVIKRGEHGAILFTPKGVFAAPAFPLEMVRDPTGAGDSFAGGMLGTLAKLDTLNESAMRQAVVMGSVMASFAVEDFSLERVQRLTQDEIRMRFHEYGQLTNFNSDGSGLWA